MSKLIKWQTWSKDYSHTAIILSDNQVVEAWQGSGNVRVIPTLSEGHTEGTEVDVYEIPCTELQERLFRAFIIEQIGKTYDYWGIVGFILRGKVQSSKKFFCSELVAAACEYAEIPLLQNIKPHQVSPTLVTRSPLPVFLKTITTN